MDGSVAVTDENTPPSPDMSFFDKFFRKSSSTG